MTTQDVNQLLAIMKANYNFAFKNMSQEEKYMLLCTWTVTLQDLPADIVMLAVMQLVSQSKWMPTVAEIREKCREIHYAAATPDTTFNMMLANGMQLTPEQQREHDRREAKRKYIAEATKHWFLGGWRQLSEEDRTVLKAFFLQESGVEAVCEALGVERAAAYKRRERAVSRLSLMLYGK